MKRGYKRGRAKDTEDRRQLEAFQKKQQELQELEAQLAEKDRSLAEGTKRFEQNYGSPPDADFGDFSPPRSSIINKKQNILIDISSDDSDDSSKIRIDSSSSFPSQSSPRSAKRLKRNKRYRQENYDHQQYDHHEEPHYEYDQQAPDYQYEQHHEPYYQYEEQEYQYSSPEEYSGRSPVYEHPPDYENFRYEPPPFYDADVRVDEMPRWPMQGDSSTSSEEDYRRPIPFWNHRVEVRIDPMPAFPMTEEEEEEEFREDPQDDPEYAASKVRDKKVRLQLRMIAKQAQWAEAQPKSAPYDEDEEKDRDRERERRERREARNTIAEYKEKVVDKMREDRQKDRERELRKLDEERAKRHALRDRKEEEEARRRRRDRRKMEELLKAAETDEMFLKYLTPAFGVLECKSERIDGTDPVEYVSKCHSVNVPKELLYGTKIAEIKGEGYKGAIMNFVDKIVGLGILDSSLRKNMQRVEKLPKFLAELVEPLCNDIAIYGTQISVTDDARNMRSNFETFCKEKSAEFWSQKEHKMKLGDFMRKYERKRSHSTSTSGERRRNDRDRRDRVRNRSRNRDRKRTASASSSSKEDSLKSLFATVSSGVTSPDYSVIDPLYHAPIYPTSNSFHQQNSEFMSYGFSNNSHQPVMNQHMDPSQFYPPGVPSQQQPQPLKAPPLMSGLLMFTPNEPVMQQPSMQAAPPQNFIPAQPMVPINASMPPQEPPAPLPVAQKDDDADLMDEIFSM
ncbi:Protein CBG08806 [Caenorhabditis briggsae]|uniref:Protein CBG08806 n=1 Tax=Caenorhabditis briggsae TaxID=6238 RepID=A8X7F6_CAEBR|nr:Protein CBG08806 [Caenorhabditis briggsae]CAP28567.1 Protein CBG08806 [Caenorhabditis briggsae]